LTPIGHWQAAVTVLAERGDGGAEVAGFFVKLERVELHRDVELGKGCVAGALGKDVLDPGERVNAATDDLVEFAEIRNPADSAVLLWSDESRRSPFGSAARFKKAFTNEAVEFLTEKLAVVVRDRVGSSVHRFRVRINVEVDLAMRVETELARE
jgi:hypothetical protein